jgi:hypothetical protein
VTACEGRRLRAGVEGHPGGAVGCSRSAGLREVPGRSNSRPKHSWNTRPKGCRRTRRRRRPAVLCSFCDHRDPGRDETPAVTGVSWCRRGDLNSGQPRVRRCPAVPPGSGSEVLRLPICRNDVSSSDEAWSAIRDHSVITCHQLIREPVEPRADTESRSRGQPCGASAGAGTFRAVSVTAHGGQSYPLRSFCFSNSRSDRIPASRRSARFSSSPVARQWGPPGGGRPPHVVTVSRGRPSADRQPIKSSCCRSGE